MSASASRGEEPRDPLLARTRRLHASDAAVARAWQRLQRREAATDPRRGKGWRAWLVLGAAAATVMLAVVAFVRWSGVPTTLATGPVGPTPPPTPTIPTPPPTPTTTSPPSGLAQAQLFALNTSDVQANLLGPSKVEVSAGVVTLLEGALFGTATNAVVIRARDVEVRVPAKAVFEVRILSTGVTVAAWQGELSVVRGEGRVEAIRDGMRSEGSPPRPEKVVRSTPTPAPTQTPTQTPTPVVPAKATTLDEGELLQRSVHELRRQKNPRQALLLLAEYDRAFPQGTLRGEARLLRIDSLLAVDDKPRALAELDALGDDLPRLELRLARGELRAHDKRFREALADLEAIDRPPFANDRDKGARLVWALAVCHAALGDHDAKRKALERYVADFPNGPRVAAARAGLE